MPSDEPYVPEQGPSKTLPSITLGTSAGFAAPPGHCKGRDVTPSSAVPPGLYETMQLLGVPDPMLADALAITRSLRVEGNYDARRLAERIEEACRAAWRVGAA